MICEKPLAPSSGDAGKLPGLPRRHSLRHATHYNLRYYPMVQQIRAMCAAGEPGEILIVHRAYSQDSLLSETDWNWRVEASHNGPSRVMADIRSHWCDMAEHVTGLRISSLSADLQPFRKRRNRPLGQADTFQPRSGDSPAFKQIFRRFYGSIADIKASAEYPLFDDAFVNLRLVEPELESNRTRQWVEVQQ